MRQILREAQGGAGEGRRTGVSIQGWIGGQCESFTCLMCIFSCGVYQVSNIPEYSIYSVADTLWDCTHTLLQIDRKTTFEIINNYCASYLNWKITRRIGCQFFKLQFYGQLLTTRKAFRLKKGLKKIMYSMFPLNYSNYSEMYFKYIM